MLTHDAQGRVVERRIERNGWRPQLWKFEWDAHDRLISCRTPQGVKWRYDYDPFGRRIAKRKVEVPPVYWDDDTQRSCVNGVPYGYKPPEEKPQDEIGRGYLWDGDTIAEDAPLLHNGQTDWTKAVRWHYQGFVPIARQENDKVHYVVTDHLGTPREGFTEYGNLVWAANYRTWGEVYSRWHSPQLEPLPIRGAAPSSFRRDPSSAETRTDFCPIRFQGQWEDSESGLYYNRFRYYDPSTCQYICPDPIGLLGGARPQGFVEAPNREADPLGLRPKVKPNDISSPGNTGTVWDAITPTQEPTPGR